MRAHEGEQQGWQRIIPRKPVWVPTLGAVLGAMVFLWLYGYEILAPQFVEWLVPGDPTQHFLGWHFFRSEPWTLPLGVIRSYSFPQGTSLVYTDSIPIIAIPLKLLASLLPDMFQYQGLWLLSCYLFQGIFACVLLRRIESNIVFIGIGTIFFLLSPIICFRAVGHESLAAHWVILAALYLYFEKYNTHSQIKWIILLSITSTIHFYLLFMVFAIWLGYLAKSLLEKFQINIASVFVYFLLSLSLIFIISWLEGAFVVKFSDAMDFGFGYFSMNLLSPFFKSYSKATPGQYEGFNYLGLGLLLAIVISFSRLLYCRDLYDSKRDFPLVVICLLLSMISLSHQVTFSEYILFKIPIPDFMEKLLSIFRSSGRMFWPVTYTIILCSLAVIIKSNNFKRSMVVLILAIVIQIVDFYPLYNMISLHGDKWNYSLRSGLWDHLAAQYKHLTIIPPHQGHDEHVPFALLAASHGMTINAGYTARTNTDGRNKYQAKLLEDFAHGEISEDSLYILKDCSLYNSHIADTALTMRLDGFIVIVPKFKEKFWQLEDSLAINLDRASGDILLNGLLANPCGTGSSRPDGELILVEDRPYLQVTTQWSLFRHHESLNAVVDLSNSTERMVDVYIALIERNGEVWFGNEGWQSRQQGRHWAPSFKAIRLSEGMQLEGNPLVLGPLNHLPTGQYTLVVVLTQSNTIEIIAKAHTSFGLEE